MKNTLAAAICFFSAALPSKAQQSEGKVAYERTSVVQIQINDNGMSGMAQQMPRTRTEKFELTFGNNQSLWKAAEAEGDNDDVSSSEGGMQIRMVVTGSDDVVFTDINKSKRVEKREFFDRTFIIDDSIRPYKWKMTGETKSILNHNCMKAVATDIRPNTRINMDNGKMERVEVVDTITIVAWFASDIPVSAGPAEYQGQLPGLILEMDINNGRQTYKATEISAKADLSIIKEPTGKKRYTTAEFRKEREKMIMEMQQNNQGGQRIIRMQ